MTTNGNGKRFKPASIAHLKEGRDAWKAETTRPGLVDEFVTEMVFEAADSDISAMAQKLADGSGVSYYEALEVLAKIGMLEGWEDPR